MVDFDKPFGPEEYARRIGEARKRMAAAGFDLLVSVDPANICWLTGYDSWSFYTPQAVLLHVEQGGPVWWGRPMDEPSAHITTDLPAEDIVMYSDALVHRPDVHAFDELSELVRARGWDKGRIAVETDAHFYSVRSHAHLVAGLPEASFVDDGNLVNWARLVKSEPELALMREAGKICTSAMMRAAETIRPGVPQNQVVAEIIHAQTMGIPGAGGDYTCLVPLLQAGDSTKTPHLTWSDKPLPSDVVAVLEIAGARRRYQVPNTRTFYLGKPPQRIQDLAKAVIEGGDAALAAAKPGVTGEQVEAIWQGVLRKHGYSKESRVGYSVGLNYPPDWGERTVSLRPGEKTVLEVGMCFHFQSGVWLDDLGAAISESFTVTPAGGERLCNAPRELIVID